MTALVIAFPKRAIHIWPGSGDPMGAFVAFGPSGALVADLVGDARSFDEYGEALDLVCDMQFRTGIQIVDHLSETGEVL